MSETDVIGGDPALPDLYEAVKAAAQELVEAYKGHAADGRVSAMEVWELLTTTSASLMRVAETFATYDGAAKKAAVLRGVESFYDQVVVPLDIPHVPEFVENRFVDPALKGFLLKLVSGTIDSLVKVFNRTGWFDTPGENGAKPAPAAAAGPPPALGFVPYAAG